MVYFHLSSATFSAPRYPTTKSRLVTDLWSKLLLVPNDSSQLVINLFTKPQNENRYLWIFEVVDERLRYLRCVSFLATTGIWWWGHGVNNRCEQLRNDALPWLQTLLICVGTVHGLSDFAPCKTKRAAHSKLTSDREFFSDPLSSMARNSYALIKSGWIF